MAVFSVQALAFCRPRTSTSLSGRRSLSLLVLLHQAAEIAERSTVGFLRLHSMDADGTVFVLNFQHPLAVKLRYVDRDLVQA